MTEEVRKVYYKLEDFLNEIADSNIEILGEPLFSWSLTAECGISLLKIVVTMPVRNKRKNFIYILIYIDVRNITEEEKERHLCLTDDWLKCIVEGIRREILIELQTKIGEKSEQGVMPFSLNTLKDGRWEVVKNE